MNDMPIGYRPPMCKYYKFVGDGKKFECTGENCPYPDGVCPDETFDKAVNEFIKKVINGYSKD